MPGAGGQASGLSRKSHLFWQGQLVAELFNILMSPFVTVSP